MNQEEKDILALYNQQKYTCYDETNWIDLIDWSYISRYHELSEKFMDCYADCLNWMFIAEYQKLSEQYIEKRPNLIHWDIISCYQKLSEEFIERHADHLDWWYVSRHLKLSGTIQDETCKPHLLNGTHPVRRNFPR